MMFTMATELKDELRTRMFQARTCDGAESGVDAEGHGAGKGVAHLLLHDLEELEDCLRPGEAGV
jgi:hypothetical protein